MLSSRHQVSPKRSREGQVYPAAVPKPNLDCPHTRYPDGAIDAYLISRMPPAAVDAFVGRVESLGSSFLGPQYKTTVLAVVGADPLNTVVTLGRNQHNPLPELFFEDESLLYVFSGYLVDDVRNGRMLRRYFGRGPRRDDRPILRSPGGIYSYATVRRSDGQICAGQSTPTLEPVYYSESPEWLHVGNNPLLVDVAARDFQRPELNDLFFFAGVPAGVAIDNSTPFVGCYRVPPRRILVSDRSSSATRLQPAPPPSYGRYRTSTYRQRRESVADALIEAGSILERLPPGELRLSGGKDSRLLAAYIKQAGISALPINQNFPEEGEGQVADMVARQLGFTACTRMPIEDFVDRNDIHGSTRRKIAFAGGLPAVAALQYPTRSEASIPGVPLLMGHAHLQRGGFASRIRSVHDAHAVAASRTVSSFLRPAYVERNLRQVRRFVNEILRTDTTVQRISFHAYLEYAMNYQFQSLYAYVRNWNPLITPLVDERFVALCEEIALSPASWIPNEFAGITDLHNERIAMGVTQALGPSLLEIPLSNGRYRSDGPHRPGFELRDPDRIEAKPIPPEDLKRVFNTRRMGANTRRALWEHIESTPVSLFAQTACKPEVWRYVSTPHSTAPEGVSVVSLNQFVWSLYGFSIILGSDWWDELATDQGSTP